jgi:hypothetical protein
MFNNVFSKIVSGQATDSYVGHVHCILATYGYKRTPSICSIYCFSTATMVARKLLDTELYVHCLSCSLRSLVEHAILIPWEEACLHNQNIGE